MISLLFVMAHSAQAQQANEKTVERHNKVRFGKARTGQSMVIFESLAAGYAKSDEQSWVTFAGDIFNHGRVWAPSPAGISVSPRTAEKISVVVMTSATKACGAIPRSLFLKFPGGSSVPYRLYAYEFIVCDETNLLRPQDMVNQYISKYGMYDEKDYDRSMAIYNNVTKNYRVGVSPLEMEEGRAGMLISVVDEDVFRDVYLAWQMALRSADARTQTRF